MKNITDFIYVDIDRLFWPGVKGVRPSPKPNMRDLIKRLHIIGNQNRIHRWKTLVPWTRVGVVIDRKGWIPVI